MKKEQYKKPLITKIKPELNSELSVIKALTRRYSAKHSKLIKLHNQLTVDCDKLSEQIKKLANNKFGFLIHSTLKRRLHVTSMLLFEAAEKEEELRKLSNLAFSEEGNLLCQVCKDENLRGAIEDILSR